MAYRRLVLTRWTRRDRLAVLTVAVAIAFFTSTVLVVTAVSAQTTAIAADQDASTSVAYVDDPAAPPTGTALPTSITTVDGRRVTVVALPNRSARRLRDGGVRLPTPPDTGVSVAGEPPTGPVTVSPTSGGDRTLPVRTRPASGSSIPGHWYVSNGSALAGTESRFEFDRTGGVPARGTPLRGALAFFVAGTGSLATLLVALAVGTGVLVGVVVYSVVRMTVRDRRAEIRLIRAVGASRRQVLGLFGGRALVLVGVGVALGYALGVIGVNAAVNVGVFLGWPTSLATGVDAAVASLLARGYGVVLACGGVAGLLATRPPVRGDPYADVASDRPTAVLPGRIGDVLEPDLLDWRALVPTAASVAVFVTVVLLLSSVAGAVAPLATGDGATVTEPGAIHPIASTVPAGYGGVLESEFDLTASPEILGFTTLDGDAVLYRGADYDRFAAVSDATLVAGRPPDARDEALVGADLAADLGLAPGDRVTLGGSTRRAFTQVEIVGTYDAPGYFDDQLLVSLPTARHLSTTDGEAVNFVRLSARPTSSASDSEVAVGELTTPARTTVGSSTRITATVLNPTASAVERTVTVHVGNETRERAVSVPAFGSTAVTVSVPATETGSLPVRVGDRRASVDVLPEDAVELVGLPERAPPGSALRVRVVDVATGSPVGDATVTVDGRTVRTDGDGTAALSVPASGRYDVRVARGGYETTTALAVTDDARRSVVASWAVPRSSTPVSSVTARLTVSNPWNRSLSRTVVLDLPGGERPVDVTLAPGDAETVTIDLGRLAPESYTLTATSDGDRLARATTTVRGDARLASAIATHSSVEGGTTGVGRAVATVFGNVQVVASVLVVFAGAMTVGGTTAAFARSVQARFGELGLYRALGASRRQVLGVVVRDGLRIGLLATLLGLLAGVAATRLLEWLGLLRVYGVSVSVALGPATVLVAIGGGLTLVVLGTVLAVWPALEREPIGLVEASDRD